MQAVASQAGLIPFFIDSFSSLKASTLLKMVLLPGVALTHTTLNEWWMSATNTPSSYKNHAVQNCP
jgi:hypothetical protein